MAITKALSDENRVRMLMALRQGELCVCRITELFQLSASTTSKHLSILYQAGLLDARKEGRWIYYKLPGKDAPEEVTNALGWITKALKDEARIIEDAKRLKSVLEINAVELCKRQCRS